MAKHAAPTEVVIASTSEETFLHRFVRRYWKTFVVLALAVSILLVYRQRARQVHLATQAASWSRMAEKVDFGGGVNPQNGMPLASRVTFPDAGALASLADELHDDPAGPWAKALEVGKLLRDGDDKGAEKAADELEKGWPKNLLAQPDLPLGHDGAPESLGSFVQNRLAAVSKWEADHPRLFSNPPLPDGSPRVQFDTSAGKIVFGLYQDAAPEHVANFLHQVEAGAWVGTRFYRVSPGRAVYGGDPNSIEGDPSTWGLGGGDETLQRERNDLHHFAHVLAMDHPRTDPKADSTLLFYVTLSDQLPLDTTGTVFGTVLEGEKVLEAIASGPLDGQRPKDPVTIQATSVLSD